MTWEFKGIVGEDPAPSFKGIYESTGKCLIILSGSKGVWEDYFKARDFFKEHGKNYDIMAVNDIAGIFKAEAVTHICSLHKRLPGPLKILRKEKSMTEDCFGHSHYPHEGVDNVWSRVPTGGDSSHFSVRVGIAMGYHKIILCGCRMDNSGHFFDPEDPQENRTTTFTGSSHDTVWMKMEKYKNIVCCVQGRPAVYTGPLTKEWLSLPSKEL